MYNNFNQTSVYKKLKDKYESIKNTSIKSLFEEDTNRANNFSIKEQGILLDYSKNILDKESLALLCEMLESLNLKEKIEKQFKGEKINISEDRAVLHTALRDRTSSSILFEGKNIIPDIKAELEKMKKISNEILSGKWRGVTDKKIKNIVNIGIGGSDLGPYMAYEALKNFKNKDIELYFVSNIDGTHLKEVLKRIALDETLFIISSKSFTTIETLNNAESAKKAFIKKFPQENAVAKHFMAISTNYEKVLEFGIKEDNILTFWDWVGGRFSLCSSIGFSLMISIGYENFIKMLEGFHSIDNHFRTQNFEKNIPVLMALITFWYNNFFSFNSQAIIPYEQYLHRFPAYLQQMDMESNGKSIDKQGKEINYKTGPVIWGEPGTNGQHAFFQLLHQGTHTIPVDFIATIKEIHGIQKHKDILLSNLLAQAKALAFGRENITQENTLPAYKTFKGNKPSNILLFDELNPFTLGQLIAIYEHKIFVLGVLWDINSFDQWGVQLGKEVATEILPVIQGKLSKSFDSSTDLVLKNIKENLND